jgi:hypothetical protein
MTSWKARNGSKADQQKRIASMATKTERERRKLELVAYHEAGHAVAAIVTGVGLISTDIKGHSSGLPALLRTGGKYLGYTRYLRDDEKAKAEDARLMIEAIVEPGDGRILVDRNAAGIHVAWRHHARDDR